MGLLKHKIFYHYYFLKYLTRTDVKIWKRNDLQILLKTILKHTEMEQIYQHLVLVSDNGVENNFETHGNGTDLSTLALASDNVVENNLSTHGNGTDLSTPCISVRQWC